MQGDSEECLQIDVSALVRGQNKKEKNRIWHCRLKCEKKWAQKKTILSFLYYRGWPHFE